MKNGRKPSVKQAKLLTANGKDYTQWLVVKALPHDITFKHRQTGETITLPVAN